MNAPAEPTLVDTHPGLVRWLGSPTPLRAFLLTALPLLTFFALLARTRDLGALRGGALVLAGVLYWTFLEYAIHRWIYHTRWRSARWRWFLEAFHLHHHRDLSDPRVLNAGPLMAYPLALGLLLPVVPLLNFDPARLGGFALGLVGAYFAYECVHFAIHYRMHARGYLRFIQRYHLHHHQQAWRRNYGNTSPLWDLILGTYDAGWRDFAPTEEQRSAMRIPS